MKKIIFLDVDGTIVDYDNHIPDSAKIAIQQSRKNGHLVFLCTGRSQAEMPNEILDIGFDGIIGGNGSYIEYKNQVLMHQLIPYETTKQVVDWLESRGLEFYLESNNGLFASRNFRDAAKQILRIYALGKGASEDQILNMEPEDALHGLVYGGELYRDDLNKISFILHSYQDHLVSKKAFPHLKAGTWGGRGESALFGDLGVKDINKAHAVNIILKHLGANHIDTIAFGDAKVDIPMLETCHIGVAMGNGGRGQVARGGRVTDDVRQDGLYNAFKKLNLL